MVSVAGAKMYGLNDRAMRTSPTGSPKTPACSRWSMSLTDRLKVRSYLNTGVLYDGFDLVRAADGRNRLEELPDSLPTVRRCSGPSQPIDAPMPPTRKGPDGLPCTAETKN
jgi:acid phosphatase type 7